MNWALASQHREAYGVKEVADVLDVPQNTVQQWRRRKKLPPPDVELACGPVWFGNDVLQRGCGRCDYGIESWLSERIEPHLGFTIPNLESEFETWDPDPGTAAAFRADVEAEERGYLSPLLLAVFRSAARAAATGVDEEEWASTLHDAFGFDEAANAFFARATQSVREDRLWPWDRVPKPKSPSDEMQTVA